MTSNNDFDGKMKLGDTLYESDNFDGARRAYEQAIDIKPDSPEAAGGLAKILLIDGCFSDAKDLYEAAMNNGLEKSAENLTNLGICYAFEGDGKDARTLLEGAVAVDPAYEPAYGALARHCMIMGDYDAADRYATEGLRIFPQNIPCLEARALAHLARLDMDQAETDAVALLLLDKDSVDGRLCLASVRMARQRIPEAITILQQARDIEPQNVEVLLALGNAYQMHGQLWKVDPCYNQAEKLNPTNWRVYQSRAGLCLIRDQWEQGLKQVDIALELYDAPVLRYLRGSLLSGMGKSAEAVVEFKLAVKQNPLDALSWISMAELEDRVPAERAKAIEHARKALSLAGSGPVADRANRVLSK